MDLTTSNYKWKKDGHKTKADPVIWSPGWHHCALPASLDVYNGCSYGCSYCFMKQKKRNWQEKGIEPFSYKTIHRFLTREGKAPDKGQWQKFHWYFNNLPYMISTRSDPFPVEEKELKATYKILSLFKGKKVLLVTKNPQGITDDYLDLGVDLAVRVSITTPDNRFEPHAPLVQDRLKAINHLIKKGVPCSIAMLPTKSDYWTKDQLNWLLDRDLYCLIMDFYYKLTTAKQFDIDIDKEKDFVYELIAAAQQKGIGYHIASVDWSEEAVHLKSKGLLSCAPDSWPKWKGMIFDKKPEIPKEALLYPLYSNERYYKHMNILLHKEDGWREFLGLPLDWDSPLNQYENDSNTPRNLYKEVKE